MALDIIANSAPFSLAFYRQLARNGRESPERLSALVTWVVDPSFYIKTTTEDTGEPVPAEVLEEVIDVLIASVPELSGGRRRVAVLEADTGSRPMAPGWVNVSFHRKLDGALGSATIGGNSGELHLTHDPERRDTGACASLAANIAEHEVVHTMGFFHTDGVGVDFYTPDCSGRGRSERVQHHAFVAYARPCANRDEDADPLQPLSRCVVATVPLGVARCMGEGEG